MEDVESILDTMPITEMAALMKIPEIQLRHITRGAVLNAIAKGGNVDNIRMVMEVAIQTMLEDAARKSK